MSFRNLFIIKSIYKILGEKIRIVRGKTKSAKCKRNTLIHLGDDNLPENHPSKKLKWL